MALEPLAIVFAVVSFLFLIGMALVCNFCVHPCVEKAMDYVEGVEMDDMTSP